MLPPPPAQQPGSTDSKDAWRRWAIDRRRARSSEEIAAARTAITDRLLRWAELASPTTVCSYLPLRTEPLAVELTDALHRRGCRVLVPVTRVDAPLQWAEYVPGRAPSTGIGRIPAPGPPLDPEDELDALRAATAVLVPALLVDADGNRLGRGGGHYDRSFALTALGAVPIRMAVVFDDELVQALPSDRHDVRVTAVVSPDVGVRLLPAD